MTEKIKAAKLFRTFFRPHWREKTKTVTFHAKSYNNFLAPGCVKLMAVLSVATLDISTILKGNFCIKIRSRSHEVVGCSVVIYIKSINTFDKPFTVEWGITNSSQESMNSISP